jgi:hypothetical protein
LQLHSSISGLRHLSMCSAKSALRRHRGRCAPVLSPSRNPVQNIVCIHLFRAPPLWALGNAFLASCCAWAHMCKQLPHLRAQRTTKLACCQHLGVGFSGAARQQHAVCRVRLQTMQLQSHTTPPTASRRMQVEQRPRHRAVPRHRIRHVPYRGDRGVRGTQPQQVPA